MLKSATMIFEFAYDGANFVHHQFVNVAKIVNILKLRVFRQLVPSCINRVARKIPKSLFENTIEQYRVFLWKVSQNLQSSSDMF